MDELAVSEEADVVDAAGPRKRGWRVPLGSLAPSCATSPRDVSIISNFV